MRYYSTGGFSKSLESEDFWERTGRAGGIFALKVDKQIVVTLSRQLSWSYFLVLLSIKNLEAKQFYGDGKLAGFAAGFDMHDGFN
ncbi:MAG: hypothetical protein WCV67_16790 [Victivallaceae bacterium]|jgi:hypothetical protein